MAQQSELDRQVEVFATKTPDQVIKAHSYLKSESDTGELLAIWFLSEGDVLTMVDLRGED